MHDPGIACDSESRAAHPHIVIRPAVPCGPPHRLFGGLGLWPQHEIENAGGLSGFEIVLGHQHLMVGRTHTDVNVRPPAIWRREVACELIPSYRVGHDRGAVRIIVAPGGPDQPELDAGVGHRVTACRRSHGAGQHVPRADGGALRRVGLIKRPLDIRPGGDACGDATGSD